MNLKHLETFRTVAQELSFVKASELLNYAQSSITGQIQSLEEEVGVRLFERRGKHVSLTDPGQRFLAYAQQLLSLADEAKVKVIGDSEAAGSLNIGIFESLCIYRLPAVLSRFYNMYPKVELTFKTGTFPDIQRALAQNMDIALILETPIQADTLVAKPLLAEKVLLLSHPDHPLAQRELISAADLDKEIFLVTESSCRYRRIFEQSLTKAGGTAARRVEFPSVEAIKQCTIANMGIAVLPEMSVMQEVSDGRLVSLKWDLSEYPLYTQLVWHKDKWHSPAMEAFIDVIVKELSTQKSSSAVK